MSRDARIKELTEQKRAIEEELRALKNINVMVGKVCVRPNNDLQGEWQLAIERKVNSRPTETRRITINISENRADLVIYLNDLIRDLEEVRALIIDQEGIGGVE